MSDDTQVETFKEDLLISWSTPLYFLSSEYKSTLQALSYGLASLCRQMLRGRIPWHWHVLVLLVERRRDDVGGGNARGL